MLKSLLLKSPFVLCAVAIGAFGASNAFRNGMLLMPGWDGYLAGSALVALLVLSGLIGALAIHAFAHRALITATLLSGILLAFNLVVLAMSVGYVAHHRTENVGSAQLKIDGYQRAEADWQRAGKAIEAATAAKAFKRLASLQQELKSAEQRMEAGRPASSDAQAETLSWVTGSRVDAATIGKGLPVGLSIALDLAFEVAVAAAGLVGNDRQQKAPPVKRVRKQKAKAKIETKAKAKAKAKPRAKAEVVKFPRIVTNAKTPLTAANRVLH